MERFCCEKIMRDLCHYCTNAFVYLLTWAILIKNYLDHLLFSIWYSLIHMSFCDCLRPETHVQTVAKNVTPHEHNSLVFSSPESTCGVQMCVHCQSDGYKSASCSEQASRGSRCSYVVLFFPWEPHRSCNQGCVLYCTGQGNTLLIAAPAQNNIHPPSGPSHLRSAVLPASSPGKPPAFWHLSGLAHLFAAIDMDGPNCSARSDSKYMLKTYCNVSVTWSWWLLGQPNTVVGNWLRWPKENIGVNLIHTEVRCDHTEYDMNANISSSWKL